jgi:ubiquinone/menaquinone biosynthesis C-methylase UbiE
MADIAKLCGIEDVEAIAQDLPFNDTALDLALMVTTISILDDIGFAFSEAHRVLTAGIHLVVALLDHEAELG